MYKTQLIKRTMIAIAISLVANATMFAQDVIMLKNGDEIKAVVQEVETEEIKYKKFDDSSGVNYTLKKSKIFKIWYENGKVDSFGEVPKNTSSNNQQDRNQQHRQLLNTIDGKYQLDEQQNVFVQKIVIESTKNKENLYNIIRQSLVSMYRDANSVIQFEDKESGVIICKGLFSDFYTNSWFGGYEKFSSYHILKCEMKEGRARLTVTVSNIDCYTPASNNAKIYTPSKTTTQHISEFYPFKVVKREQTNKVYGEVVYALIKRSLNLIDQIEESILNPQNQINTNDDW